MLSIVLRASTPLFDYGNSNAAGQLSHRRWKVGVFVIHDKAEDAASYSAAEAMKGLPLRIHMKGRSLFLVKGAEGLETATRSFEWKIRANHFDDIGGGSNLFDDLW
jgi:xylose isomerase